MLFSSITFLYLFLPFTILLYFLVPQKGKNFVLLVMSLLFYAWGEPVYVLLMFVQIVISYVLLWFVDRYRERRAAGIFYILSALLPFAALFYFKYFHFFMDMVFGIRIKTIALPIGISFYTFQIVRYCVDVYRGKVERQKNLVTYAAYVTLFPQLVAGPIVRYSEIEHTLTEGIDFSQFHVKFRQGVVRFAVGLGKKVLIANVIGEFVAEVAALGTRNLALSWAYAIAVSLQIYFDFSGYSDMAVGMGQMLGFNFPENFNYPYQSKSITEFWRRWHISLSTWFKEYVYIPLGGSRKGFARQALNLFTVWALTGLWHGAAWNFVIWGIYFFILLLIEKCFLLKLLEKIPKAICHLYALFFIITGWVIFAYGDITSPSSYIKALAGINAPFFNNYAVYKLYTGIFLLAIMAVASTRLPVHIFNQLTARLNKTACFWIKATFTFIILITSMALLISGSYNPFLYFRF